MIGKSAPAIGMTVRKANGDELGKIVAIDEQGIHIEKGFFFPRGYILSKDQVDRISHGEIYLKQNTSLIEDEGLWSDYNSESSFFSQISSQEDLSIPLRKKKPESDDHHESKLKSAE
jgi:hypothetical protein